MRWRVSIVFSVLLMCCVLAAGKKKKVLLPADILQARMVLVVVDPDAGMSIEAPNANRSAQDDVEAAILKWGRFTLASDLANADLVLEIRKGNGKIGGGTIGGVPNGRPIARGPGSSSNPDDPANPGPMDPNDPANPGQMNRGGLNRGGPMSGAHPEVEARRVKDMMTVYRGRRGDALDTPPVWRYSANDAFEPPSVPAVEAFRKLIAEAEKQQANQP